MPDLEQSPPEQTGSDLLDPVKRANIIADTASDAIITIDEASTILFINRAAESIFGYSVNEMLGHHLTMLMPECVRHLHRTGLQRYIETGIKHISWKAIELPGLRKDGKEIVLEISFGELFQNGKRFFTGIARDITKRKQDELRLVLQNFVTQILAEAVSLTETSKNLLQTICRHMNWQVGEVWRVPPERDHLNLVSYWHSPSVDVSALYTAGQTTTFAPGVGIPGRIWATKAPLWLDYIPEGERFPRANAELCAALGFPIMSGSEVVGVIDFFSYTIPHPEPTLIETLAIIGSQIGQFFERNNAQDEVQRGLAREHNSRLQAEEQTRRLSALQRVTDAALATFSLDALLVELLKRIREVLNVDTAAVLLLEKEEDELLAWPAVGLEEQVERGVRIPVGKGFAGRIVAERRHLIIPDVEQADVYNSLLQEKGIRSLLGVPLFVEGRVIGVIHVGTFRPSNFTEDDISLLQLVADRIALSIEKARLNEIERSAREAAEKANLLKDEFLKILSHELRTPLTPILGWSRMMQADLLTKEDYGQALDVITRNSQSMKHLIDDLLDMSAILSGKMRIEQLPVSLASILREVVGNMSTEARGARIELFLSLPEDEITVKGDSARLLQTFSNILHNAIKFTPENGLIEITAALHGTDVVVSIRDSGIGIEKDFIPHVFERFRQADGSRTRSHGGLGLGLALVRSFVEAHGGEISVASEGKGHGTVFSIRLPLESSSGSTSNEQTQLLSSGETAQARILIVEDQPDTLDMLTATFAARGFEVSSCMSGAEALTAAQQVDFDVIVSDIAMPEIDGFELIRELRQLPRFKNIPAIALTGYASEKDAAAAMRAGFDIYLCKPVDPAELTTLIENLLQSNQHNTR